MFIRYLCFGFDCNRFRKIS